MAKPTVLAVIGPTAVGKSKFAIDLCLSLNQSNIPAEIVNADSMQVYKRFNIGTAKVSLEEQALVPHHLINICEAYDEYNVHRYFLDASNTIEKLHKKGILPVLVGGSCLYIELLLIKSIISNESERKKEAIYARKESCDDLNDILQGLSSVEAHALLYKLDPGRAEMLHPNDYRRIVRSLEVYYSTKKSYSELMQRDKTCTDELLRYNTLALWLDIENDAYRNQIVRRISSMLKMGLLKELFELRKDLISANKIFFNDTENNHITFDYSRGVAQSIAYKEFSEILENLSIQMESQVPLDVLEKCTQSLIKQTLCYAKKQRKWFYNTLLQHLSPHLNVYSIQVAGDIDWMSGAITTCTTLIIDFLKNCPYHFDHPFSITHYSPEAETLICQHREISKRNYDTLHCHKCSIQCYSYKQYEQHLHSRRHRKRKQSKCSFGQAS